MRKIAEENMTLARDQKAFQSYLNDEVSYHISEFRMCLSVGLDEQPECLSMRYRTELFCFTEILSKLCSFLFLADRFICACSSIKERILLLSKLGL